MKLFTIFKNQIIRKPADIQGEDLWRSEEKLEISD